MPTINYKVVVEPEKVNPELWKYIKGRVIPDKPFRLVSATTVLRPYGDSGGLVHSAWDYGMQGIDYRDAWGSEADAGTLCHKMIEHDIHGKPEPVWGNYSDDIIFKAQRSYEAYKQWTSQVNLTLGDTENSLISMEWLFGGTYDVGEVNGEPAILDFKTGKGPFSNHLCQIAGAYSILRNENYPMEAKPKWFYLLRISKDDGSIHHHQWPSELAEVAEAQFKYLRILYETDKILNKKL